MCTTTGYSLTNPSQIKSLGVNPNLRTKSGQPVSADLQQKQAVADIIKGIQRPQQKLITAKATATANDAVATLGNSFGLSSDGDTTVTWAFQNPVGKTAFNAAIIGAPFRYLGLQIDVSDEAIFNTAAFTELINDYDNNQTKDFGPQVNAGINTLALNEKTRFLNVAGEFNGFWGLKTSALENTQWIRYSFYCVSINRGW